MARGKDVAAPFPMAAPHSLPARQADSTRVLREMRAIPAVGIHIARRDIVASWMGSRYDQVTGFRPLIVRSEHESIHPAVGKRRCSGVFK